MNKIVLIIAAMLLIVGGSYFFSQKNSVQPDSALGIIDPSEITMTPESYDIGEVVMKGGLVEREYEIKNSSKNTLRVKKIVTSCMCTKAAILFGDKKTRFYGMEMSGDKNPNINFDIPGGSSAKLAVRFDPAAHGIAGKGPVDRSIWVTFADPVGTKEVKFFGEVVIQ